MGKIRLQPLPSVPARRKTQAVHCAEHQVACDGPSGDVSERASHDRIGERGEEGQQVHRCEGHDRVGIGGEASCQIRVAHEALLKGHRS